MSSGDETLCLPARYKAKTSSRTLSMRKGGKGSDQLRLTRAFQSKKTDQNSLVMWWNPTIKGG